MALSDTDIDRIADRVVEKLRDEFPVLGIPPVMLDAAIRARPATALTDATLPRDPLTEGGTPTPNE